MTGRLGALQIHPRITLRSIALPLGFALMAMQAVSVCAQVRSERPTEPIRISADHAQEWTDGQDQMMILRGNCRIRQGQTAYEARKMVLWHRSLRVADRNPLGKPMDVFRVYLEEEARVQHPGRTTNHANLFIELQTEAEVETQIGNTLSLPGDHDPLLERARRRDRLESRSSLTQTQFVVQQNGAGPALQRAPTSTDSVPEFRRIRVFPRSSEYSVNSFKSTQTTPPEQVWIIKGGVNLLIDGIQEIGVVDLSADRMIIWTLPGDSDQLRSESLQLKDTPFQVYMEGNIEVRQGQNVMRASHAFYDAREDRALMLNAELRSYVPAIQGDMRVRAERIRQLSRRNFHAQNAWATTSQFGRPGYRVESSDVFLDYRYQSSTGLNRPTTIDPATGLPVPEEVPWITSLNNRFLIHEAPVFYLPQLSAPAEDPNVPIRRASITHDNIFGTQVRTVWDLSKLTGVQLPAGTEWNLNADYLSDRGPGVGTNGNYVGQNPFGIPGLYRGRGDVYYIHDTGFDDLGADRRALALPESHRGRARLLHRHELPNQMLLFGEIGYVSDRNFLEQYYENEFDRSKQQETLLYLKQDVGNWSWSALGRAQTNDFEVNTGWYPKADLYTFSEPLLGGMFSWTQHSSAGYGQLFQAATPTDANDLFVPLPYVTDAQGAVAMSRHEVDMPFNLGPLVLDPYVMGEAAYWGEGFDGNSIDRFVGSAGIRGSLTMWRVFPHVQSRIFNLNGLAHKIVLKGEYSYIDSTRSLASIPQYNEFDDDSQERFRERLIVNTYGGTLPMQVEPRFYQVRDGSANSVAVPYHELIDDQQVIRLSARQRLQTKVGPPDRRRIVDWMILDAGVSYFPQQDRDNFGENWGLLFGKYEWNVGSRTRILAGALYDVFDGGQEVWNLGVLSQRSARGSVYLGLRQYKAGALDSRIATASYTYRMGPKWISTFGTAYDMAEGANRGQSITFTRVGADFLVHVAGNYDRSKDNVGFAIAIEPRIGAMSNSMTQLSSLLGLQ